MTHEHDEAPRLSGSLKMREPQELAGSWAIETPSQACTVTFTMRRIDTANGWAIDDSAACLAALVPGAVAWRPVPEGVALADADRRTLALFTASGDAPTATASLNGTVVTLRRN